MTRLSLRLCSIVCATASLALAACASPAPTNPSPTPTTAAAPSTGESSTLSATDVGVTKDSILLGGTAPLSGPAAAYGALARASDAYFHYTNDNGGVNERKITYRYLDDAYNPAQTVPLTKQLVEQDQIFLFYFGSGTQTQTSVRDYLNSREVPQVFTATGATTFPLSSTDIPTPPAGNPRIRASR